MTPIRGSAIKPESPPTDGEDNRATDAATGISLSAVEQCGFDLVPMGYVLAVICGFLSSGMYPR